MNLSKIWIDIISVAVAITLVNGSITGALYSSGRGGRRTPFARVKSIPVRVTLFLLGLGIIAWIIVDGRKALP